MVAVIEIGLVDGSEATFDAEWYELKSFGVELRWNEDGFERTVAYPWAQVLRIDVTKKLEGWDPTSQ